MRGTLAALIGVAFGACGGPPADAPSAADEEILFADVTVVPMTGGAEIPHANVLVRRDRIERVDGAPGPAPPRVRTIDGHGKFLMPGLADMHVHLPREGPESEIERVALLSLLNGVTTLRGMQGAPGHLAFRERTRHEDVASPELFLAGPPLEESLTPEQARARVREQKAAGYDAIKVLGGFDRAAYDAVVVEARKVGMPVVGHVPAEIGIDAALAARQLSIEHLMGYSDAAKAGDAELGSLARRTRDAHVWNCPTLDYAETATSADVAALEARRGLDYASRADRDAWQKRDPPKPGASDVMIRLRREVLALQRAGAKLLVGSDSPGTYIVPGFGYLEEMRELERAGLTPAEVLTAATTSAAESLGRDPRDGTVQAGAIADLILVPQDPLAGIDAVSSPEVVMVRGRAWTREEIKARLGPPEPLDPPAR